MVRTLDSGTGMPMGNQTDSQGMANYFSNHLKRGKRAMSSGARPHRPRSPSPWGLVTAGVGNYADTKPRFVEKYLVADTHSSFTPEP
jgi:hypothetical protein